MCRINVSVTKYGALSEYYDPHTHKIERQKILDVAATHAESHVSSKVISTSGIRAITIVMCGSIRFLI